MFLEMPSNNFANLKPLVSIELTTYVILHPTVEKYRNCKPATEANDAQKSADPLINLDSEYSLPQTSFQFPVLLLWDGEGWLKKPTQLLKWLSKHVWTNRLHTHLSPQPTMSGLNRASDPQLEETSRCQLNNGGFQEDGVHWMENIGLCCCCFFLYYSLGPSSFIPLITNQAFLW